MTGTPKTTEETRDDGSPGGFSARERAAMKARAAELREERGARGSSRSAKDEAAVLAKIAEMAPPDRVLAERLHAVVTAAAPDLAPKLWYGQPAYARAGKVLCFFRSGQVDGERYSTFGFTPEASLDEDGGLWPTSFAVTRLDDAGEAAIGELVRRATR
jgi:uncharacterized protein YdhG (YjbR/CyaY superfamily)